MGTQRQFCGRAADCLYQRHATADNTKRFARGQKIVPRTSFLRHPQCTAIATDRCTRGGMQTQHLRRRKVEDEILIVGFHAAMLGTGPSP